MTWFNNQICVPFGNPNYDSAYGGAHDEDVSATPNTPVTSIVSGVVCDLSSPSWGKQVGIALDSNWFQLSHSVPYWAYLHLSAINPTLRIGNRVQVGDLIGWSGGCTVASQYNGTSNPTGSNFLNNPSQSSQPQIGFALMRGPVYGSGPGWENFPPVDYALDPTPILQAARNGVIPMDYQAAWLQVIWNYLVQVDYTTGIAHSWQALARNGTFYGPPLGGEKDGTTWDGAKIKIQCFAAGWCEWHEDTTSGPFGPHWQKYA